MHLMIWLLSLGLMKNEIYLSATTSSYQSRQHSCAYCTLVHKEHITHIYLKDLNRHIHGITVPECPEGISSISPSVVDARVDVSAYGSDPQSTAADAPRLSPDVPSIHFPHNLSTIYEASDSAVPWPIAAPMVTHRRLCKRFDHLVAGCSLHKGLRVYGDEDHSFESSTFLSHPLECGAGTSTALRDWLHTLAPRVASSLALMVSNAWNSLTVLCAYMVWSLWAYRQVLFGGILGCMLGCILTIGVQNFLTPTSNPAPVQGMVWQALPPRLQRAGGSDVCRDQDGRECRVCMDALPDVLLQPCNHLCLCSACSRQLCRMQPGAPCPVCRAAVSCTKGCLCSRGMHMIKPWFFPQVCLLAMKCLLALGFGSCVMTSSSHPMWASCSFANSSSLHINMSTESAYNWVCAVSRILRECKAGQNTAIFPEKQQQPLAGWSIREVERQRSWVCDYFWLCQPSYNILLLEVRMQVLLLPPPLMQLNQYTIMKKTYLQVRDCISNVTMKL